MERSLLVTIKLESEKDKWRTEDIAEELEELAAACGAEVVDNLACSCHRPTPNLFIGKGKAEEIAILCQEENIATVIFSHDLSGTQQRNLEEAIGRKTIDRTQLILHIFARHARSPEGKMQVELAQLQYLLPRLIGKGLILSRQGAGIGTSGPGEQKLEVDRRRIRKRIDKLNQDLQHFSLHRQTIRKKRRENTVPAISLVGYTNAGKSTLLNALTAAGQVVSGSLFTTLDPLSKSLILPNGEAVVISDTVGFLYRLPHHLIEAFKATLEEVNEADLLLNVLDVSHPLALAHNKAVIEVLKQLEADEKPMLTILNKIDLVPDKHRLDQMKADFPAAVLISAKFKLNLEILLQEIQNRFLERMSLVELVIAPPYMDLVNLLYRSGSVKDIKYFPDAAEIRVSLPPAVFNKIISDIRIKNYRTLQATE